MKRAFPWLQPPHMLDEMRKTISMSELAKNAERIAQDIEARGTIYRIKRPGKRRLMLVDSQYVERWRETVEVLAQHPNLEHELAGGDREYREGTCVQLEDVMRELGIEAPPDHASRRTTTRRASSRRRRPDR